MATEGVTGRREQARAWLMLASGTATAAGEAWLVFSRLKPSPQRFVVGEIFWSALMVGIAVSGGAVAAWLAGFLLPGRRPGETAEVWRSAAVGWAFVPAVAMLAQRGSWWALPAAALATVAAMARFRPPLQEVEPNGSVEPANGMRSLYGLGVPEAPPWEWIVVAACGQAALALAVRGWIATASLALCLCLVLGISWGTARNGRWGRIWAGRRRATLLYAVAAVLMLLATPWMMGGGGGTGVAAASARKTNNPAGERGHGGTSFVGVILWPPPVKKAEIVPPRPDSPLQGRGIGSKPLVIPFDGPYWYFKAPDAEPGPKAHVTFGKPTEAKVRSTNWMPLRMEAHQNLGLPIELDCCREIDVKVTNADLHVGIIMVSVLLTDNGSRPARSTILGEEPVVSSVQGLPVEGQQAVTETLKFPIPATAKLRRFDQIDVVIQPTMERARQGARVAVDEFELVPR